MKKQEKKDYEVPRLTAVEFKVEKGFAVSGTPIGPEVDPAALNMLEERNDGGSWAGNDW